MLQKLFILSTQLSGVGRNDSVLGQKIELTGDPPYSPDLEPSDFYLFPSMKNKLRNPCFSNREEVIDAFKIHDWETTICHGKSLFEAEEDDSVVSIYTTEPTTAKTARTFDVYHQIANNIAERLTSPIYKFLGIGKERAETTTKRTWEKLEFLDEEDLVTKAGSDPVNNDLSEGRDIEELSVEALKQDKKPEKITLYSSYLPSNSELNTRNDTVNEIPDEFDDDPFEFDDDEEKPREGGVIYFLELIGSVIQLAWGAFVALFKPSNKSS
ncbi:hypothetical protein EVAR_14466_1 [Eumeta japonica]|uniref:Histone-lysine N-methyltransferase SETMAR n=1 Tax=Eumeta variegata TaxID=151549 RepID=A0A4C1U366_EUMVA|nr:hypothetical protein EVAR_14466_1 [Eumeta japonica]